MIRINLLEEAQKPKGARRTPAAAAAAAGAPGANMLLVGLIYGGIIGLAVLAVGGYSFLLKREISQLNADIEKAKARVAELRKVIELNEQLNQKRALLRRKIEVIAMLKKQQAVPVQMLDRISENLAEYVWLEGLAVTGTRVKLTGKAQNYYAIAKFLLNLDQSNWFDDIIPGAITGGDTSVQSFSVEFTFIVPPDADTTAALPAGATGTAASTTQAAGAPAPPSGTTP